MPRIHVCSLRGLHEMVTATGARDVLTVMRNVDQVIRPVEIMPERHLKLDFSDIVEAREGQHLAQEQDVAALIEFARRWDRQAPLVVHCYAGVSRSTASAFISACALKPEENEEIWAQALRKLSPTATPNIHLVRLGDALLGRNGRMIRAIEAIGRGQDCFEGVPFALEIGPR